MFYLLEKIDWLMVNIASSYVVLIHYNLLIGTNRSSSQTSCVCLSISWSVSYFVCLSVKSLYSTCSLLCSSYTLWPVVGTTHPSIQTKCVFLSICLSVSDFVCLFVCVVFVFEFLSKMFYLIEKDYRLMVDIASCCVVLIHRDLLVETCCPSNQTIYVCLSIFLSVSDSVFWSVKSLYLSFFLNVFTW